MSDSGSNARARRIPIEHGPGLRQGVTDLRESLNALTISAGIFPAIAIALAGYALYVNGLTEAGLPNGAVVAWITAASVLGGLLGIVLSLYYKMPIAGASSIPGFVLVVSALQTSSLSEVFGGFWLAGALVLLLGVTGTIRRVVNLLPVPVMLGMVAGILLDFPLGIVDSFGESAIIAGAGLIGYIIFDRLGGILRYIPGVLGVVILGVIAASIVGQLNFSAFELGFGQINFVAPSFTLVSLISIAIPLALVVVGAENMQATGVLISADYDPPINSMTISSGLGGLLAALVGAHNANIAGPVTAATASPDAGAPKGRYAASAIAGLVFVLIGLGAGTMVALLNVIPTSLTLMLLGVVLVKPIISAIQGAWGTGRFSTGAFVAFLIAVSGVSILGISAPFWSLLGGAIASLIFEFGDYRDLLRSYQNPDEA